MLNSTKGNIRKLNYNYNNTFSFIDMRVALQGKNIQTYLMIELNIYCFMNKQYVEGVRNRKKNW